MLRVGACVSLVLVVLTRESAASNTSAKGIGKRTGVQRQNAQQACIEQIASKDPDHGAMLRVGAHLAWADRNDPVQRAGMAKFRTYLVEPQPALSAQLKDMAASEYPGRVTVLNAAVCPSDGNVTFYSIRTDIPGLHLMTQLASLSRAYVENQLLLPCCGFHADRAKSPQDSLLRRWTDEDALREAIAETPLPCLSISSIVKGFKAAQLTLRVMTVDAEGFDLDIVETIPQHVLSSLQLLSYESIHLAPGDFDKHKHFITRLEQHFGFDCRGTHLSSRLNAKAVTDIHNVWCVKPSACPGSGYQLAATYNQTSVTG